MYEEKNRDMAGFSTPAADINMPSSTRHVVPTAKRKNATTTHYT